MSVPIEDILEEIPYTIPWWNDLLDSLIHWPYRLWRRLNTLVDLYQWQCQGKLWLYVRTALPALGQMVLGLLHFDWDDVARGAIRPFGPYGRRSLVAGARKPKWKIEVPELGEEIGKRLPGVSIIKASKVWRGTRAFWIVDGLVQRVLYYYLIIDLVSEFAYNWALGILRAPAECGAAYIVQGGYYGDSGGAGWKHLLLGGPFSKVVEEPDEPMGFWIDGGWILVERPVAILGVYELHPVFPVNCRLRWRMGLHKDGEDWLREVTPWAYSYPGDVDTVMTVFHPPGPGRYRLVGEVDWSTCSTISQHLVTLAIKPVREFSSL